MFAHALLVATATHARPPTMAELDKALTDYNIAAEFKLPRFTPKQLQTLLDGDVLRVIDRPGTDKSTPRRALGLLLTDVSRGEMWVSCQDTDFPQSDLAVETRVAFTPPDRATWYGYMPLPMPFSDRHWVIDVWNNHALAAATGGAAWEHPWKLAADGPRIARETVAAGKIDGVDLDMLDKAIYTPFNQGAWFAVALPGGQSIFGYHVSTVVGGNVPEGLMVRMAHTSLSRTLRNLEKRGREVIPGHYLAGHWPVIGGDGQPVPTLSP